MDKTIKPIKEVQNKDVSVESFSETLRVTTWYKPRKNAAISGSNYFISKIDNPGRRIIKTPKKPTKIAIQVLGETFSLSISADKATIITGVSEPTLCTSARERQRKAKTKQPDSMIEKKLRNTCNLTLLDCQNL